MYPGVLGSHLRMSQVLQFGPFRQQGPSLPNFHLPSGLLQTAPFAIQCPPASLYLVSCLPRIPFCPLGTAPLPLGCAVQPIIQLLVLPRVLGLSVKPDPPPLPAAPIRNPHFSSSMTQSFLFSSQCAPEPPAQPQVSGLLCYTFWCIPPLVPSVQPRSLSLLTGLA